MSDKQHLRERPLFSARYGRVGDRDRQERLADMMPWAGRHAAVPNADLAPERRRCRCNGSQYGEVTSCLIAATQEDLLCDECREWCVAVDGAGKFHLIADLPRRA